eukprot:m.74488 g.74488  ORF g.74488 m.74488 type:complete len:92 (+) comp14363_c0_seq4:1370-1645(+)
MYIPKDSTWRSNKRNMIKSVSKKACHLNINPPPSSLNLSDKALSNKGIKHSLSCPLRSLVRSSYPALEIQQQTTLRLQTGMAESSRHTTSY